MAHRNFLLLQTQAVTNSLLLLILRQVRRGSSSFHSLRDEYSHRNPYFYFDIQYFLCPVDP